jgi:hypothetical protein
MGVRVDDPLAAIASAVAATEAARTARVLFRSEIDFAGLALPRTWTPGSARPGRLNPLRPVLGRLARGAVGLFAGPHDAEGFVDFERRLVAMDYGAYAVVVEAGREWGGLSGRARSTLPERPAGWAQPLWLIDLLRGTVQAQPAGDEVVRGVRCVRLAGRADLGLAERHSGRPMAVPAVPRVEDLAEIPIDCWIDTARLLRRVRVDIVRSIEGVDLFDFGVHVEPDWLDMPRFRSPVGDACDSGACPEPD